MFEPLKIRWHGLTMLARASLLAATLAIALLLAGGSYWILKDDYQVLFSDLAAQDAAAMVGELERIKVPYRLTDNGTTILVEREAVYKTRLKLMGKGLDLHGAVGFEIFNNADFGMTEFAQKVNYQRAIQGELARTIMGFDEIKQARVLLVLPESGLFKSKNTKPKASISLVMKAGSQLTPEQIIGIQRLVAASVTEIDASAVTIVDQRGVAVSRPAGGDDTEEASSGTRLDTKKQIEEYLTRKIANVLDRAVGPGRAIVSIDATLNYDQINISKEDVVPLPNTSGQRVGAITRQRESTQGNDATFDVSAHSASKIMPPTSSLSTSVETEFINSRRVENIVAASGNISRLSIGVLVPANLDAIQLAKLKEVITMAAGINLARGDAVAVYNVDSPAIAVNDQQSATPEILKSKTVNGDAKSISFNAGAAMLCLLAVVLLAAAAWILSNRKQPSTLARLSDSEREHMLRQVAEWAAGRGGQNV